MEEMKRHEDGMGVPLGGREELSAQGECSASDNDVCS
jgi:hypothetical protein